MTETIDKNEYKRVSISLTQPFQDKLKHIAKQRTLSQSATIRALIQEEWKRKGYKEEELSRDASSPAG